MHPQDPPPYPQQSPYPQQPGYGQQPSYPPQYPPTQSYPPYPVDAPPQYPGYPPYPNSGPQPYGGHPQPAYGHPPHPPAKRTEFGWASIIVGSIALLTSVIPYFGIVGVLAAIVLVLAGWLGRHERSRVPAAIGTVITALALVSTVIFTLLWRDIFRGFFGF